MLYSFSEVEILMPANSYSLLLGELIAFGLLTYYKTSIFMKSESQFTVGRPKSESQQGAGLINYRLGLLNVQGEVPSHSD